jgi:hypothetical protein
LPTGGIRESSLYGPVTEALIHNIATAELVRLKIEGDDLSPEGSLDKKNQSTFADFIEAIMKTSINETDQKTFKK